MGREKILFKVYLSWKKCVWSSLYSICWFLLRFLAAKFFRIFVGMLLGAKKKKSVHEGGVGLFVELLYFICHFFPCIQLWYEYNDPLFLVLFWYSFTWHTVSHLWLRYFVHFSHFTLPISTPTPGSWSTFAGQRGKPITHQYIEGFPDGSDSKRVCLQCGRPGSIPWSGRSPGEGNGNPLQYSCLENPTDGGAWQATVPGVPRSPTRLSNFTFIFT